MGIAMEIGESVNAMQYMQPIFELLTGKVPFRTFSKHFGAIFQLQNLYKEFGWIVSQKEKCNILHSTVKVRVYSESYIYQVPNKQYALSTWLHTPCFGAN